MENGIISTLLGRIIKILNEKGALGIKNEELSKIPVINFLHPNELKDVIDFSLQTFGISDEKLEKLAENVIEYSVKTNHPHFHNQLYGGYDKYGFIGTLISESLNTNQYTYEVAPVFSLAENAILTHILQKIGYSNGDGIFSPGGSVSNMYGIVLARYKAYPDIKTKGMFAMPALVAFTSQDAHYSIEKAVHWLGIGTDNLIKVKTDDNGRMIPSELEVAIKRAIENGRKPFFVNATAGTTVLGAFDPFEQIADICEKYQIWLHVDACLGGALLLSKLYKDRLKGLNRADSISWNPHKLLGAPLQCSAFLVKYKDIMFHCNSVGAKYLFQQDKFYDVSYDTGDKSIQCGRKVDAFKLWFMWKARGDDNLNDSVDAAIDCARYFKNKIEHREDFVLVLKHFECTCICFWYIPKSFRNKPKTEEWWNKMHKVAPLVKEKLTKAGSLMIGYTPLDHKKLKNFFRMVVTCQPPPTFTDMDYVISQIDRFGQDIDINLL